MAHIKKFTSGSTGNMLNHYSRATKNNGNKEIDKNKTYLNHNLASQDQPLKQIDFIRERKTQIKIQKRKDINIMATWVITAPISIANDYDKCESFFKETYKFLNDRYDVKNVVSSYIHYDETTPHMHYCFMPIIKTINKRTNEDIEKLSAKEVINKKDLTTFHTDLQKHLDKTLSFKCDVITNETVKQGNKSIKELKEQTLQEAQDQAFTIIENAKNKLRESQKQYNSLVDKYRNIDIQFKTELEYLQGLQAYKTAISNKEYKVSNKPFSKEQYITLPLKDYENLESIAQHQQAFNEITDYLKIMKNQLHRYQELQDRNDKQQIAYNDLQKDINSINKQYQYINEELDNLKTVLERSLKPQALDYIYQKAEEQKHINKRQNYIHDDDLER